VIDVALLALCLVQPAETPPARQIEPAVPAPAETADAPAPAPAVSEDAWRAVVGKQVAVQTGAGEVNGELASADGSNLVIIGADGAVQSIPKANASGVRVVSPPPSAAPPPAEEAPQFPTTAPTEEEADPESDDPEDERKRKRDERRAKRQHALLGAYTAQGASYAHWRGDGINAGHAAYAMDFAVGVNPTPGFGMYLLGGGLLGTRIDNKTVNANYGRIAFTFAFGGKYYFSTFGAGVGFSRLALTTETQKDIGLSLPMKIFGKIPLPKKLYIGIGLAYDVGVVRGFSRSINGIGGQIIFGRW
jgi:hypothetical protein